MPCLQVIRRLSADVFDPSKFIERQLHPGFTTKLLTFQDAIEFVMVLPGQTAMAVRQQFARIIREYIAGERSLIAEINANAASDSPLAQMARASAPPSSDETAVGFKRRREELELSKLEEEIKAMAQSRIITAAGEIERMRDPTRCNLDERTRLMVQDALQNSILTGTQQQPLLTDGSSPSPNAPISISSVATALGYKLTTNESKRVGHDIRKRYQRLHGKAPPKHDQLCDGRVTLVNSYTEQDRQLVTDALHAFYARAPEDEPDTSD
jgi:hypothetical protein